MNKIEQPKYKPQKDGYESNPFRVVINGFNNVFNHNSTVTLQLIAISFVILIVNSGFNNFDPFLKETNVSFNLVAISLIIGIFLMVANIIIQSMAWLLGVQSAKHKQHKIDDYFKHTTDNFWKLMGFTILYGFIIIFGLILFIIPGIIFAFWYSLTPIIILDQNKSVFEAMKLSKKMIKGMFWEWAGVSVATAILSFGGILSVPSYGGGMGLFYYQLKNLKDANLTKPKTHWSNYLIIIVSTMLIILAIALFAILMLALPSLQG